MFWKRVSALLIILFLLSVNTTEVHRYIGYTKAVWSELQGCAVAGGYGELQPALESVGTWIKGGGENIGRCLSSPITALGPVVEVEYGGYPDLRPGREAYVEVLLSATERMQLALPYPQLARLGETWVRTQFELPQYRPGMTFQLRVVDQAAVDHGGWLALRNRVSFFEPPFWISQLKKSLNFPLVHIGLVLLGAFLIVSLARSPMANCSTSEFFLVCFSISVVMYFRPSLYFFWDEWHTFDRFMHSGTSIFWETHNEHFIPLFLSFFYAEGKLFGDCYSAFIFVSLFLHAINAVLLRRFLLLLLPGCTETADNGVDSRHVTSTALSLFFVAHGFSPSLLHWSFLQAIVFCETFLLLAMIFSLCFLQRGGTTNYVSALLAAAVAPFFFGGGLIASLHVGFVLLLQAPYWQYFLSRERFRAMPLQTREQLWRATKLLVALACISAVVVYVYASHRHGIGYGVELANIPDHFGDMTALLGYTFVGSQLGTILRGLGFFPILELEDSIQLFPIGVRALFDSKWVIAGSVAGCGLAVVVGAVWLIRRYARNPERTLRYFVLGEAIIVSTLFLPALGRAQWGLLGSLAIRYHYACLVGLIIILLPLFERLQTRFVQFAAILVIALQLHYASSFDYFTKFGRFNRDFVAQMTEWRALLANIASKPSYDALGSELVGMEPWIPYRLAPDYHPDQVQQVLNYLAPNKFPLP